MVVKNTHRERQNGDGKEVQKYVPSWVNSGLFKKKSQRGHAQ